MLFRSDGGGDRSATIAAMRIFVPELEARGYRFVPVSELSGMPRDRIMPKVSPSDRAMLGGDRLAFNLLWFLQTLLHGAFLTGIVLGTLRVLFVTALALVAAWRERSRRKRVVADAPPLTVSVLIAAYHEAPVIGRTLEAVLASREIGRAHV